jgi:hypothetical protein
MQRCGEQVPLMKMAEGVGFEPTVGLPLLLISSQVPLTTQPPFLNGRTYFSRIRVWGKLIRRASKPSETISPGDNVVFSEPITPSLVGLVQN